MKILTLIMVVAFIAGCSNTNQRKEMFIDGADTCNKICINNSKMGEYSQKSSGGITLLFIGGMEEKCNCNRSQPNNLL